MDAIARTAYYCCGVRAADAASATPICGDDFAQRFMTDEGREVFKSFSQMKYPNASNATRARIIDDWLRQALAADPRQLVVLVGAGFDTRAFRLAGGSWVELDQPAIIARKNEVLPVAEARNPLQRVAIDFATDALAEKLAPWAGAQDAIVVLEGVSEYLTQPQLRASLDTFRATFPRHSLICDLMSETFRAKYTSAMRVELRKFGADFATLSDDPAAALRAAGYSEIARTSMVAHARALGAIRIPGFLFHTWFRSLRDGYCAYRFHSGSEQPSGHSRSRR